MILKAEKIAPVKFGRQIRTPAQRVGLAYQRKVTAAFKLSAPKAIDIYPNLWFSYCETQTQATSWAICSPDLLAIDVDHGFIVVIEVKNTYTPLAFQKLRDTYCPVVARAFGQPCKPLVVCKNLVPGCPRPAPTISFALLSDEPLFHWIGLGPILW